MNVFSDLVEWVRGRAAEGIASFSLPAAVADGGPDGSDAFRPNEVYLEVRVQQIWLTRERELWREFQPFAAVVCEFARRGERAAVPAILGTSELTQKLQLLQADDAIEIRNLRVAGPTPYEGDDVSILLALFRTKTGDWLSRTLTVVEGLARAIGATALIDAKPVADAIVGSISQFLGMEQLELRVGQYASWSSPVDPERPGATELRPMHHVVMRRPMADIGEDPSRSFAVVDGRLHRRDRDGTEPYREHDFVLLSVTPRAVRDDFRQLEFYEHWQQAQRLLVDGDVTAAERAWRRTAGALYSDDLTGPHQQLLYAEYKKRWDEMTLRFAESAERTTRSADVAGVAPGLELDEQDPADILRAAR